MTEDREPRCDTCQRCQYEQECFPILKLGHQYLGIPCRQGRKRKVMRQSNIAEFPEVTA